MSHNQISKKVEGEYSICHESDSIEIRFENGYMLVRNSMNLVSLLQCSPNVNYKGVPITRYRVKN
jgi:hypothetical protein